MINHLRRIPKSEGVKNDNGKIKIEGVVPDREIEVKPDGNKMMKANVKLLKSEQVTKESDSQVKTELKKESHQERECLPERFE